MAVYCLTLFIMMNLTTWFDIINLGLYITRGCRLEFLNKDVFQCLKISFILDNSADSDEMLHYAAFHLSPQCLPKDSFSSIQRVKGGFCTYILCMR